ncbi:MAG: general secretion pathway protein GspK [SAR86 cluster bacterium]|nr:general secretion pathway protein GspK [SAR86 cluster bacterium]|tara:strand:- start:15122 stop:16057 length:936 start_codon:yes stop_codon:yes gene_type:complete
MKRGFVLISTLSIVAILSFLILIINKTVVQDSIKSYIFNESIHKRIQLINYEKFLIETLQNNSNQLRNLSLAEQQINFLMKEKYENLNVTFTDLNTCVNLNSSVKKFRETLIRENKNNIVFQRLFQSLDIDESFANYFYDKLVDFIDSDSLPERLGAEDLFYIADEDSNFTSDSYLLSTTQLKDLKVLDIETYNLIKPLFCAIPENYNKFNINSLNESNYLAFSAMFPDITLNDFEQIILNKPITGYINLSHFFELTNMDEGKIIQENIIFKPEYIRISYLLKLEGYEFSMHSVINLKERSNNLISRSFVI